MIVGVEVVLKNLDKLLVRIYIDLNYFHLFKNNNIKSKNDWFFKRINLSHFNIYGCFIQRKCDG